MSWQNVQITLWRHKNSIPVAGSRFGNPVDFLGLDIVEDFFPPFFWIGNLFVKYVPIDNVFLMKSFKISIVLLRPNDVSIALTNEAFNPSQA